jgi:hypothetical protein
MLLLVFMTDFAKIAVGWSRVGLAANDSALYTFSFLLMLYLTVFSILFARERQSFWATMPGWRHLQ